MTARAWPYDEAAYDFSKDAPSYWRAQTPSPFNPESSLEGEQSADIAIIGAGYTGLHAALRLVQRHGAKVAVLDAAKPGWGASSRNGGFCTKGGAFLGTPDITRRFGGAESDRWNAAQIEAVEFVRAFLNDNNINADTHSDGEWALAHAPSAIETLKRESIEFSGPEELRPSFFAKHELTDIGMAAPHFHAALKNPVGFALNPAKYVDALAVNARQAGVTIYENSRVIRIDHSGNNFKLSTKGGTLCAKRLLVATNGYTPEPLANGLRGATLPIMSNIIVTRPLTESDCLAQGWTSRNMAFDTRLFLHYFRLLPDNRFLFGMRGGANASPGGIQKTERRARRHFDALFPAWRDVEHDYFWSGFVCFTRNLAPYAGPIGGLPGAWAAFGYHGGGVAMASWLGCKMADVVAGVEPHNVLPAVLRAPLRKIPLSEFKLAGLAMALGLSDIVEPLPRNQSR